MPKFFREKTQEQSVPRYALRFLGGMPGYDREYRLTAENGVSSENLRDIAAALKKDFPDWDIVWRGDRVEIIPAKNLADHRRIVADAVKRAASGGQVAEK